MNAGPADRSGVIAFRVDASLEIGSGHVMRCLTLADALRERGNECHFLCRAHPGHLMAMIQARGHQVHRLPDAPLTEGEDNVQGAAHAAWLGTDWLSDAQQSRALLERLTPAWLVIDHYALDACWERAAVTENSRVLVIDDLADRPHQAEILLDQNLGREPGDYANLVPHDCHILAGPHYALLRPEFAQWRTYSLQRRSVPSLRNLFITMGGVDKDNATGLVLSALKQCDLPVDCTISVVMGGRAPHLEAVKSLAKTMSRPTEVAVDVSDMAQRMARADLAIGAAGSTSWERCCLGLPTLMTVLADNQADIATHLDRQGAAINLGAMNSPRWAGRLAQEVQAVVAGPQRLHAMAWRAEQMTDGQGAKRVAAILRDKDVKCV